MAAGTWTGPVSNDFAPAHLETTIDGVPRVVPITPPGVCRIGRENRNTIVLDDSLVSRYHALIDFRGSSFYLTDLGSRNGTLLNERRITGPMMLKDGDRIAIGQSSFVFRCNKSANQPVTRSSVAMAKTEIVVAVQAITVLVADVRGYTALAQKLPPERLSGMMASFFRDSGLLLCNNGAWAQKYIGDAVMAVWTHGPELPDGPPLRRVLESAVALFDIAAGLHTMFGLDAPVRIGVGVNTGYGSLGNLGSDVSADYTALGDTVNKAFRLEAATRLVDYDLLIGTTTYDRLGPEFLNASFEPRTVELKGYEAPQLAYAISADSLRALFR